MKHTEYPVVSTSKVDFLGKYPAGGGGATTAPVTGVNTGSLC